MPKDTNTLTEAERETKIRREKELADSSLRIWRARKQEPIDQDYKEALAKIPEQEKLIKEAAKERWASREKEIKGIWEEQKRGHRRDAKEKVASLNDEYARQMKEISIQFNDRDAQVEAEYKEAAKKAEQLHDAEVVKLKLEKEDLEARLAKEKKENEKSIKDLDARVARVNLDIDELTTQINRRNRKRQDTTELERQHDDLHKKLTGLLKDKAFYVEGEIRLENQLKEAEAALDPDKLGQKLRARIEPFFNARNEKRTALIYEQQKVMGEKKAELLKEIKDAEALVKREEHLEDNPVLYEQEKIANEKWEKENIEYHTKKITDEATQKKEAAIKEIQETYTKLADRLYKGVEFKVDAGILATSAKRGKKPNTEEFTAMTNALDKVAQTAGQCDESPEVEAELRRNCLEAYKKCQDYVKAKADQGFLHNYFRSDEGNDRIRMANEMMTKLKELCPELEQALETGNVTVQEQAQARPNRKEPKVNVKAELDAAKAKLAKQNGEKNPNPNLEQKQNQNQSQKQGVMGMH